jgi:hypothetical protein
MRDEFGNPSNGFNKANKSQPLKKRNRSEPIQKSEENLIPIYKGCKIKSKGGDCPCDRSCEKVIGHTYKD